MAPCGCCQERPMSGDHVFSMNTKWKCLYTRFFRFSLVTVLVFLGMQYGFSALVMTRQLTWLRIRSLYGANMTDDHVQQTHNVTGLVWNSSDYTNNPLQRSTIRLKGETSTNRDLVLYTLQLPVASTTATSLHQNKTSTQAPSVTLTTRRSKPGLVPCPQLPPNLVGRHQISVQSIPQEQLDANHPDVLPGGQWRPLGCKSRHRVALIIPYRNREEHLRIFLNYMHPFLQKQQLDYGIYIVEQAPGSKFNRAMLMNIGFVEASKLYDYQCFFFHDVDLLPEDDRNIYSCPEQPRHMSAAVNTMHYRLPYDAIFGGVAAMKTKHFKLINGFSNKFFGWGGEDDDLYNRIHHHHLRLSRYPINIARYTMMKHVKDVANPQRFKILYSGANRFTTDGLNSLKYKLLSLEKKKLCTWIRVRIDKPR